MAAVLKNPQILVIQFRIFRLVASPCVGRVGLVLPARSGWMLVLATWERLATFETQLWPTMLGIKADEYWFWHCINQRPQ